MPIQVGDRRALIFRTPNSGSLSLGWAAGNTYVRIDALLLSEEEVIRVAESMQTYTGEASRSTRSAS